MNMRSTLNTVFSIASLVLGTVAALGEGPTPRGGRVAWGRLVTESLSWRVHGENDTVLATFIRENTSLNIDPTCYSADPSRLEELSKYPFIFTNNLTNVTDPSRLANIREYLYRGGFIYIDRCVNLAYSLPQEPFYERHVALFARLLPGCAIRELPDNHAIYHCYFTLDGTGTRLRMGHIEAGHNGIYGVYVENRMVVLLSLANLQCGWPNSPAKRDACMKMIANIYVYAMTRPGSLPVQR
jgi:hypothetical protein